METVGRALNERGAELMAALEAARAREGDALAALMVTDIMGRSSDVYLVGDRAAIARAFGGRVDGGRVELRGVMSRKKQVAPELLGALGRR